MNHIYTFSTNTVDLFSFFIYMSQYGNYSLTLHTVTVHYAPTIHCDVLSLINGWVHFILTYKKIYPCFVNPLAVKATGGSLSDVLNQL